MNRSRFDWITNPGLPATGENWDIPVLESDRFVVLPSKGSLVPGWLLIVPRRPTINLSCLSASEKQELKALRLRLRRVMKFFGGRLFEFEHGASAEGSVMGCGVDQAHLHLVPLSFNLLGIAMAKGEVSWQPYAHGDDPWQHVPRGSDYLLIEGEDGLGAVGQPLIAESQWFRRLIAKEINLGDSWNYRDHPFRENVAKTLAVVASASSV